MKFWRVFILLGTAAVVIACDGGTNNPASNAAPPPAPQQQAATPRQTIVANNFSDLEWKNGVFVKNGRSNVFYYLQPQADSPKVKAGDILLFGKTGRATVEKVSESFKPNAQGLLSMFVTVDRDLDPAGDGYPNSIHVVQ